MSFDARSTRRRRRRRALSVLSIVAGTPGLILGVASLSPGGTPRAQGQPLAVEVTPQTDAAVPAHEVVMLGSSPQEVADETWGIGEIGSQSQSTWAIVRYTPEAGWSLAPAIQDGAGAALSGFTPASSQLAGSITPDGSGALLGSVAEAKEPRELLLMRDPGQPFTETSSEPTLEKGEHLFDPQKRVAPMVAALEEGSGSAGALVVPVSSESANEVTSVLHWTDSTHAWSTEPIEVPQSSREAGGFTVLSIAASSPGNAWLLARLQNGSSSLALFRREEGAHGAVWQPVAPAPEEPAGAPLQVPLAAGKHTPMIAEPAGGQSLTVSVPRTGESGVQGGVWVDGARSDTLTPTTMYFKPEGADSGSVLASWCEATASAEQCTHTLTEELPTQLNEALSLPNGPSRSFAWANSSAPFGERVITGLNEGVSLRLEGETFKRVLALGSSAAYSVGADHGAAFSTPTEGWLGSARLPVHITQSPEENLLESYPVPFRHPLLAIAAQPGAPAGALASEAVAVGEAGEVARYAPGVGWQPESLLNVAGVRQTPQLRAVAWPTPSRVFAVGTAGPAGSMWLWRAETGLWEKDPATPVNFRGDLLGVAFDPENASRGYAVGQGGVLLRYGKTWTQEATCATGVPEPCLPAEVAGASFTSVAFAGQEAIVAYRVPHFTFSGQTSSFSYTGGLLVNGGSGWQIDTAAAAALASEAQDIPWAVAALPDGGAALSAESAAGVPRVLERNSAGAPWEATAQPYPGFGAPGALALFREGGALRVVGSGSVPDTARTDEQTPPPAGFPPALINPYPLARPPAFMLRQTASGWSDEEHDHDEVGPPQGNYKQYDKGFEPDPSWAMLIGPTGTSGWAVGGFPKGESEAGFETADIARYAYPSAETTPPPGVSRETVPVEANTTAFAIGGGSQCGAPCASRAKARIGPDTWLSTAIRQAHETPGVKAFLYTGPRLTNGETLVKATLGVPYADEFSRYSEVLAAGGSGFAYAAASATDNVPSEGECLFKRSFPQFAFVEDEANACAAAHYSFSRAGAGGTVKVIVIDDSTTVQPAQLAWLETQLAEASRDREPAIVVGNADLNVEQERGEDEASKVVQAMVAGKASAYFFDVPEQNLKLTLRGSTIPAYGSGTLGYVSVQSSELPEFIGASGFLLAQVGPFEAAGATAGGHPNAHVTAELIPNIGEGEHGREGELALEAQQGTLLRRSQVAAFAGLARRPRAGNEAFGESESENFSYLFTPIPANCVGAICAEAILPEYSFTSSNEEVGRFVEQELNSTEPNAVKFNSKEEPIFEEQHRASATAPWESKSGLLCALNPGKTEVKIKAGGFSASLLVTVQAGSVRRPCGTVPVKNHSAQEKQLAPPPPPPPTPAAAVTPAASPPILPLPPAPAAVSPPPARTPVHPSAPPFFLAPTLPVLIPAIVPPPLPAPANPTPPSGTSAVTSPVEAAQKEEEHEEATESVSNQAVAYRTSEYEPSPLFLLGFLLLAAFAGASVRRRPRRGRREVRVAPATISTIRSQRRLEQQDWRRRR